MIRDFDHAEEGGDGRLGGACLPITHLVLAFGPDGVGSAEDHDAFLAGGVVSGDVEQVAGGTGLQVGKLVDQGLIGHPGEECADDVCVDDIREGVASLGEPMDVIM